MSNLVQNSKEFLIMVLSWFKMKGLSNRASNMMFYTFPHLLNAVLRNYIVSFFMRNSGYPYSSKRFVVYSNRANFLAFHARIA